VVRSTKVAAHFLQIVTRILSKLFTTHATLSTQPRTILSVSFLCLALIALPILPKSYLPLRNSFDWDCSGFAFACFVLDFFFSSLSFFSFGGIFRQFWFLFVVPYFANFSIFSIFEKFSFWLVCVVSCQLDPRRAAAAKHTIGVQSNRIWHGRLDRQLFILLNLRPLTTLSFQPTSQHTTHPTMM